MLSTRIAACAAPLALLAWFAVTALPPAPVPSRVFGGQEPVVREPVEVKKTKDCQTVCEEAGGACPAGTVCSWGISSSICEESYVQQSAKCVSGERFVTCTDPGSGNCQSKDQGRVDPATGNCSCSRSVSFCGVKQTCSGS